MAWSTAPEAWRWSHPLTQMLGFHLNHTCIYSTGLSSPSVSCLHTCHWPLSFIIDVMEFFQAVWTLFANEILRLGSPKVQLSYFHQYFSADHTIVHSKNPFAFSSSFHPYGGLRSLQSSPSSQPTSSFPWLLLAPTHGSSGCCHSPRSVTQSLEGKKKWKVLYWRNNSL